MANGEMKAHESTYNRFLALFRYGAITVFVLAAIVVWIIAR